MLAGAPMSHSTAISLLNFPLKESTKLLSVRLSRPREIQLDTLLVSPDIAIPGNKLRSLVDMDRLGIA
jgi:hypothetical protein